LGDPEYKKMRAQFLEEWNNRQYDACLKTIKACVAQLGTCITDGPAGVDSLLLKELRVIVAYRVAVSILINIKALSSSEANNSTIALQAKFLAELPLIGQHRIDTIRLAIDKYDCTQLWCCLQTSPGAYASQSSR